MKPSRNDQVGSQQRVALMRVLISENSPLVIHFGPLTRLTFIV